MNKQQTFKILFYLFFVLWALQGRADDKSDFLLGPGDSIHIAVYRNPELTLDIRVDADGTVTIPLLGATKVGGLRVAEAENLIGKGLRDGGYLKDPHVNITLIITRANSVAILGQVNRPGMYPIENANLHLSEALALAGGIATTNSVMGSLPSGNKVILKGVRNGQPYLKEVDLSSIYLDKKLEDDVIVLARDEIYVPFLMFYIYGEVQRPGSFPVARSMTVMQALSQGGGLSPRGTERSITLFRRNSSGVVEKIHPAMSDLIQPDDVLNVPESLF